MKGINSLVFDEGGNYHAKELLVLGNYLFVKYTITYDIECIMGFIFSRIFFFTTYLHERAARVQMSSGKKIREKTNPIMHERSYVIEFNA